MQNSLCVAGGTMSLAVLLGCIAALWAAGLDGFWRRVVVALAIIAFMFPPFLVTNCWLHLLGGTGPGWLEIYSVAGVVWILGLMSWPLVFLAALAAWSKLDQAHLEAHPDLRGAALIRWLLWPAARTAVALAAVVVFVLALNHFSVPAILQVKVFPAELWVAFNTRLLDLSSNALEVASLAWPLILAPCLAALVWWRRAVFWPGPHQRVTSRAFREQVGSYCFCGAGVLAVALLVCSVGLPVVDLVGRTATWAELGSAVDASLGTILNSALLATGGATVAAGVGLVLWRWRWGGLTWLLLFTPGILIGLVWIWLFNRPMLSWFFPSLLGVAIAFGLRYLGIGWGGAVRALKPLQAGLRDVARVDGLSRWAVWRHVYWPQAGPFLAVVWYWVYVLCLWDVETLILIVPPGGETVSLRVFNLLHYGHTGQVNALCLVLLALALAPGLVWKAAAWGRRRIRPLAFAPLLLLGCSQDQPEWSSSLFTRAEVLGERGTGPGQFSKPRSVAVDGADYLYVVDLTARVQRFSPEGLYVNLWQMPETDRGRPKGMCGDPAGGVYVVEPHYARVNRYDPLGSLVAQWGARGTNDGQLAFPRAVALTSAGHALVSEYGPVERVQRFTPDGARWLGTFGRPGHGPAEFNRPEGLGVDRLGRIFVADSCNHRVQVFGPEGQWLHSFGQAGDGPGEFSYPYDVRVDQAGYLFVCEFGNSRIQIFDKNEKFVEMLGGPGLVPGRFSNPWSIALDSHGNLFVADAGNHRVQKFIRNVPLSVKRTFRLEPVAKVPSPVGVQALACSGGTKNGPFHADNLKVGLQQRTFATASNLSPEQRVEVAIERYAFSATVNLVERVSSRAGVRTARSARPFDRLPPSLFELWRAGRSLAPPKGEMYSWENREALNGYIERPTSNVELQTLNIREEGG